MTGLGRHYANITLGRHAVFVKLSPDYIEENGLRSIYATDIPRWRPRCVDIHSIYLFSETLQHCNLTLRLCKPCRTTSHRRPRNSRRGRRSSLSDTASASTSRSTARTTREFVRVLSSCLNVFSTHSKRMSPQTLTRRWVTKCFNERGHYRRTNINMPRALPLRSDGHQSFALDTPLTEMGYLQAKITGE